MNLIVLKKWAPLIIILVLMISAYAAGLHEKISLEILQDNKENLLQAVADRPVVTAIAFIATYIFFVALSLPAATLLTLTGGFLFGKWLGTLYVVSAATIGATIIFFIAKTSLGTTLREKAGILYNRIEGNMNENAVGYLLFMRLVPVFPFFLVNIVPALFNVKPRIFIMTTFFGIIPGSFVYVNLGQQLGQIESIKDLVSTETILSFALLGVFALLPTIYKQIKTRKKTMLTVLASVCVLSSGSAYASDQYNKFLDMYDGLLKEHVAFVATHKSGIQFNGVDYDGWAKDARYATAKELLLSTNPKASLDQKEKMAYWVNSYNFLTIDLIVQTKERETIRNQGTFFTNVWKSHKWTLAGQEYSLDQIEHRILRPMGDARIHFAINCASISCPDLRQESYRSEKLDAQLDEQVRATISNTGKGTRAHNGTLYISKIFDWFFEDFNNGDVKAWLSAYVPAAGEAPIAYMDYNWSLNKTQ